MQTQIPPPTNWQDFEHLCWRLWKRIWNDPQAQKNGRSGDPQAGVDIFGRPDRGEFWAGVQCKGKDSYAEKKLTGQEVRREVEKAKSFLPALGSYVIATSGRCDVRVLQLARNITDSHRNQKLFTVVVYGWDDIVDLLGEHTDLRADYPTEIGYREGTIVAPSRLPNTGELLFGRGEELKQLDQAWEDPSVHILSLVAWGGVGKTALVKHWLGRISADRSRGARRVFDWSFYSQGSSDKEASSDPFFSTALRWFGDPDPAQGNPWDKGERMARLVSREPTLLILDGLEPPQHPPGVMEGQLKDPTLATMLKGLAASNRGLCVITTREPVAEIAHLTASTAPRIELRHLSPTDGARLLAGLGVKGTEADLREASDGFSGHALAVTLLGTWLSDLHGGDVGRWRDVPLLEEDEERGGPARRIMTSYREWLKGRPDWPMLRLIGFFDRPAKPEAIRALLAPPAIEGLTEDLVGLTPEKRLRVLARLRRLRLLAESPGEEMDAHPLVREYMGHEVGELKQASREGHRRLYEHYRGEAPELPATLEELGPLYRAVHHGCRAGLHQRALDEVWRSRILRQEEQFSAQKLAAFGAELEAVAGFFEHLWDRPAPELSLEGQAFVLHQAGLYLRALGRLKDAAVPLRAGLNMREEGKDWEDAAIIAGNLSELEGTRGALDDAEGLGRRSVELADRSGAASRRIDSRALLAEALHQRGRTVEAETLLAKAEAMQEEGMPRFPLLHSLAGYRSCDLRLGGTEGEAWRGWLWTGDVARTSLAVFQEVCERAARTLEWATDLLDIAAVHLTLGRAALLEGLVAMAAGTGEHAEALLAEARSQLDEAVGGLRQAGHQDDVPCGLIARACLRGVFEDPAGALEDLREAEEISGRGPMKLHQADVHLNRSRLRLGWRLRGAVSGPEAISLAEVRRDFDEGKRLIDECGYHRRDPEMADLEAALAEAERGGDGRK